jgi:hypothetical protein
MAHITPPVITAPGGMLFNCTLKGSKVQNPAENSANGPKKEASEFAA